MKLVAEGRQGEKVEPGAQATGVGVNAWMSLTTTEKSLILVGLVAWVLITLQISPPFGSTDVYLFRDAAFNLVHGEGFTSAVRSESPKFDRVLFSSYTPGALWSFVPFAAAIRNGPWAGQIYHSVLAVIGDFAALFLIVACASPGWKRVLAISLLAASLPAGCLGGEMDRPENLSLVLLILLLLTLRRSQRAPAFVLSALIAACAFLAEPFAGIVGAFLIAGAIVLDDSPEIAPYRARAVLYRGLVAGLAFIAPLALVAAAFQLRDPQSLHRFAQHALVTGGVAPLAQRSVVLHGAGPPKADIAPASSSPVGGLARTMAFYRSALRFQLECGGRLYEFIGVLTHAVAFIWLALCLRGGTGSRRRFPLVVLGLILFVFPTAVFPKQPNYPLLSRCLFPFALATNWAGSRYCLRSNKPIGLLVLLNLFLACVPLPFLTLMRFENRDSYREAGRQVSALEAYLDSQPLRGGVVLVPESQYYLYKNRIDNIFDPSHIESYHDPNRILAVVSCNTATHYFSAGSNPLPDLVADRRWRVLTAAQHQVSVGLFGRRLMHSNWTWACDIYVPEEPGKPSF